MRTFGRTTLSLAVVVSALAGPQAAAFAQQSPDLEQLQVSLEAAAAQSAALGAALEEQAAQDGGLRVALERLEEQRAQAQSRLDARVRSLWISQRHDPFAGWREGLRDPSLRRLPARTAGAGVTRDRELLDAVAEQAGASSSLRAQAAQLREQLRARATDALAAQDRARSLLAQAEQVLAQRQAAAEQAASAAAARAATASAAASARAAGAAEADRLRLTQAQLRLSGVRSTLDSASATVTRALSPAQSARSARARAAEGPVLARVEAAGGGYPQGYVPSGRVLSGLASWYGPGFVGSPTASGTPYDPERMTCAHKTLPLGTVLRVSANGRAVSCLVNDRGPYVGPRILDLSRAGSRALGFDGVQQVVVEVLTLQ